MNLKKLIQFLLFLFFIKFLLFANNENQKDNNIKKEKLNISNVITEHLGDSHEWLIINIMNKKISIPLPIVLWNNGFEFFTSTAFFKSNVIKGKHGYYKMFSDKIYNTNKNGKLLIDKKGIPCNRKPLDFSMTKNVASIFLSSIILCFIFLKMKKRYKYNQIRWKLGIFLEAIILFIRDEIAIPYIGKKKYKKFFPFLLTFFFFILINNIMGLIPNFPNVTGNINITLALSLIMFFVTNINGSKSYWKHTFLMPNVPKLIKLILIPIELIGIFIRPFTLAIRLFANITAGHIIILSFICLIFIFKNIFAIGFSITFSLFISILEIMVSFLQSFIFTTISALLIGMSIKNYEKQIQQK
ncbi:F0F1 ATP synthase subunit A [Blattabacterium cuenoti]|uniref:ATP synthase subunit a n=1 Tax=Blattabacterium sp. (Amazonina sp.) TaxID=2712787 RepID=A0A6G6BY63_9FLAO|nr:F0F1 ATP synthase subunit A [Blattabacterium cuenoti]QID56909.1 ATP synthase subunit A [Blattabacterium sp. (Amazonina sp.)]